MPCASFIHPLDSYVDFDNNHINVIELDIFTVIIQWFSFQVLIFDRSVGRVVQLSVVEDYGLMLLRTAADNFR